MTRKNRTARRRRDRLQAAREERYLDGYLIAQRIVHFQPSPSLDDYAWRAWFELRRGKPDAYHSTQQILRQQGYRQAHVALRLASIDRAVAHPGNRT